MNDTLLITLMIFNEVFDDEGTPLEGGNHFDDLKSSLIHYNQWLIVSDAAGVKGPRGLRGAHVREPGKYSHERWEITPA